MSDKDEGDGCPPEDEREAASRIRNPSPGERRAATAAAMVRVREAFELAKCADSEVFERFSEGPNGNFSEAINADQADQVAAAMRATHQRKMDPLIASGTRPASYSEHFGDSPNPNGVWEEIWCEGGPPLCFQEFVFDDEPVSPSGKPRGLQRNVVTKMGVSAAYERFRKRHSHGQ